MKKTAIPFVVTISVLLAGCAIPIQYSGELRIYESIPKRPVVAVGRFVDVRKDKTIGSSGGVRMEPKGDVGIALQEQIAKAIYASKLNVIFVDEPTDTNADPHRIIEESGADMLIQGVLRNFQIRSAGSVWIPADVKGRLTVTTLVRGEKDSRHHEVLITGTRRSKMGFGYGNDLYLRALGLISVGVIDDPNVKLEFEKVSGGERT